MNKNKYVTFEQAKLLKELGYNEPVFCRYNSKGTFWQNELYVDGVRYVGVDELCYDNNELEFSCSAPTLHEATDWLRDKGLYTYPKLNALNKWYAVVNFLEYAETVRQEEMFDDFYSALSHGIDYCLSALKYKDK